MTSKMYFSLITGLIFLMIGVILLYRKYKKVPNLGEKPVEVSFFSIPYVFLMISFISFTELYALGIEDFISETDSYLLVTIRDYLIPVIIGVVISIVPEFLVRKSFQSS